MIPNVKFLLKKPNGNSETLVSFCVRFNKHKVLISTKQKVHPAFWNFDTQRADSKSNYFEHEELNDLLDDYEKTFKKLFKSYLMDKKYPNLPEIRNALITKFHNHNDYSDNDFIRFIEQFIQRRKQNATVKRNTYKSYITALNHLKNFQKKMNREIRFDNIDLEFYEEYTQFLKGIGLNLNSIGKEVKNLKTFLNDASRRNKFDGTNYQINNTFQSTEFKKPEQLVNRIYLNEEEIIQLMELDLSDKPHLAFTRDWFIIGCYTGLRFIDWEQVNEKNIRSDADGSFLYAIATKTNEPLVIPVFEEVKTILSKYNGNLPKPYTNQAFNRHLKTIGELANKKYGKSWNKKHNHLKTHVGRRSMATNMYKRGIDAISIMQITGHKSEKTFLLYICITKEENARRLMKRILNPNKLKAVG